MLWLKWTESYLKVCVKEEGIQLSHFNVTNWTNCRNKLNFVNCIESEKNAVVLFAEWFRMSFIAGWQKLWWEIISLSQKFASRMEIINAVCFPTNAFIKCLFLQMYPNVFVNVSWAIQNSHLASKIPLNIKLKSNSIWFQSLTLKWKLNVDENNNNIFVFHFKRIHQRMAHESIRFALRYASVSLLTIQFSFFPFVWFFFIIFYTFSLLSGKVERTQNTHHLVPKITIRCSKIYGLNEERSYFNVIFNGANGIWEPGGETIQCNFLFLLLVGTTICCHSKCISMKKKGITLICIIFELSLHE